MKLASAVDRYRLRAVLTFRDSEGNEDWVHNMVALDGSDGFPHGYQVLVDTRRVPALSPRFIDGFSGWLSEWCRRAPSARWALVAEEGTGYGAARELALRAVAEGGQLAVFTSHTSSLEWLRGSASVSVSGTERLARTA